MGTQICRECNSVVEGDARFCGACGASLPSLGPAQVDQILDIMADQPAGAGRPTGGSLEMDASPPPTGLAPSLVSGTPIPAPRSVSLDRLIGRTLNHRYQVLRKIGEGGFGAVFEGKQMATGRGVALKVLHPHSVADPTVVARFRREAEACSQLRNPHTVTIYDFDQTEDGVLYLAMELVRGESLQDVQRRQGVIDPDRTLRILDQVAEALGEAHEKGIVHRDMKPENIMVERREEQDFVKVLDFGIAKIITGDGKGGPALTAVGQTVGTLEFMSPEQLRGKTLDGRSDIYALGMVAYEMLTGRLPFKGAKNATEIIHFHLQEEPPAPSAMRPDLGLPSEIDELVLKMVAKGCEERHSDSHALRQHIAGTLKAIEAAPVRRELVRVVAVIGALVAVLGTAVYFLSR